MDKALQDRLSDIVKALTKQFADKADTRKALKIHEKQFQNLYNLIMSKGGGDNNKMQRQENSRMDGTSGLQKTGVKDLSFKMVFLASSVHAADSRFGFSKRLNDLDDEK